LNKQPAVYWFISDISAFLFIGALKSSYYDDVIKPRPHYVHRRAHLVWIGALSNNDIRICLSVACC